MARRDRLGRRIGFNWWREYVVGEYEPNRYAWEALRESDHPVYGAAGAANSGAAAYQLSDEEFRALHPPPTFKGFLIALAGADRSMAGI